MNVLHLGVFRKSIFYKVLFLLLLLSVSSFSFSATRSGYICDKEWRTDHYNKTDPSYMSLTAKATCHFNRWEDDEAIQFLERAIEHGGVISARLLARYYETDGTFEELEMPVRDSEVLDKAIQAYTEVLDLIDSIPNYPENDFSYMLNEQDEIEIGTIYSIVRGYFNRFGYQIEDHYHRFIHNSPSYEVVLTESDKAGVSDLYPALNNRDTFYILDKMEEFASRCINTPKFRLWDTKSYNNYIRGCKLMKDFAQKVRPLERLKLANAEICSDFVLQKESSCIEYRSLIKQILRLQALAINHPDQEEQTIANVVNISVE